MLLKLYNPQNYNSSNFGKLIYNNLNSYQDCIIIFKSYAFSIIIEKENSFSINLFEVISKEEDIFICKLIEEKNKISGINNVIDFFINEMLKKYQSLNIDTFPYNEIIFSFVDDYEEQLIVS
jgi:hypothetical protein